MAEVLSAIYEEDFLGWSPDSGRGAATRRAGCTGRGTVDDQKVNHVLDADIRRFTIP